MIYSRYFPHVLYSVAITSISIHLVSQRRAVTDDRARVKAQICILESLATQLQSNQPLSTEDLGRLKKLARPASNTESLLPPKEEIGWKEMIFGLKKTGEPEISVWEKRDIENLQKAIAKEQ